MLIAVGTLFENDGGLWRGVGDVERCGVTHHSVSQLMDLVVMDTVSDFL